VTSDPIDRLAYFAALVAESPEEPRARFGYANELLRAKRHSEAVQELRVYLSLAEDEGNAWGRLAESLTALGRPDEAADAYLSGIDQAIKHGHTGMAEDFQRALEAL
jgi:predicted Zn-dependent protease